MWPLHRLCRVEIVPVPLWVFTQLINDSPKVCSVIPAAINRVRPLVHALPHVVAHDSIIFKVSTLGVQAEGQSHFACHDTIFFKGRWHDFGCVARVVDFHQDLALGVAAIALAFSKEVLRVRLDWAQGSLHEP